jgi:bifunctional DNA-binding transcriptional regulator/antitoxin component of YhaV-PrlF toxin-antitoxin module
MSTSGLSGRLRKALNLRPGDQVEMEEDTLIVRLIVRRKSPKAAKLIRGKFGRPVLVAAKSFPAMTTDSVIKLRNFDL